MPLVTPHGCAGKPRGKVTVFIALHRWCCRIECRWCRLARRGYAVQRLHLIEACVNQPLLIDLPLLNQTRVREQPRTLLRHLLPKPGLDTVASPWTSAHADPRVPRIIAPGGGQFLFEQQRHFRSNGHFGAKQRSIRIVGAACTRGKVELGIGAQCKAPIKETPGHTNTNQLSRSCFGRNGFLLHGLKHSAHDQAAQRVTRLDTGDIACTALLHRGLPKHFTAQTEIVGGAVFAFDSVFAGIGFRCRRKSRTKQKILLAKIELACCFLAAVLNGSDHRLCRPGEVSVALRSFQLKMSLRCELHVQVNRVQLKIGTSRTVTQDGHPEFAVTIIELYCRP